MVKKWERRTVHKASACQAVRSNYKQVIHHTPIKAPSANALEGRQIQSCSTSTNRAGPCNFAHLKSQLVRESVRERACTLWCINQWTMVASGAHAAKRVLHRHEARGQWCACCHLDRQRVAAKRVLHKT